MTASTRASRWVLVVILVLVQLAGCSRLRLPAIDPTGQRIFNPLPATTSIALPGSAGEGRLGNCFRKLGDPLNVRPFSLPEPAFPEPADPPACLTPVPNTPAAPLTSVGGAPSGPCVPSAPCTEDCKHGPPAILYGNECQMKELCRLPKRGKRGCILLSPQKIVAPVGGEVLLLSGICGDQGYLQVGEPLEWMLTPESVGTFIQVGDDDPGVMHRLARIKKASKQDPSYAFGVTSTKRVKITRGNLNPNDDVQLEKGQTWISVSSPSEGTSKVTVLAPESECWDQRKATATIYWVDAARQFPGTQIVPAGTPVTLTTRVTRSEGMLPARGWKVYYEIMQPELGSFASTGASFVEATVDGEGNATVQLIPTPGTSGTAAIAMRVIRPGGETDNMPPLTLFTGETFVTWSAPQLAIRAGAPSIASFGIPFEAAAAVSNPGDQAATNVRVVMQIPPGVQASSTDSFAQNLPNAIVWEIGELPAQQELDLLLNVTTESSMVLNFEARADGPLVATTSVTVDVFRPSLVLSVAPEKDRYEVGEEVTFNIDVRNTGDRPLTNLQLIANGDDSMLHTPSNLRRVVKPKQDPNTQEDIPLQPGETWPVAVTFIATDPGRRCIQLEATADAGQRATTESCVTVVNQPPPTPAVSATLSGRSRTSVGNETLFRGVIVNTGSVPLDNVKVTMAYDPQLSPLGATDQYLSDSRSGQYMIEWVIPRMEPETSETLEANFQVIGTNPRSTVVLAVESQQGARASEQLQFEILPAAVRQPAPAPAPPNNLPPATAPPMIPDRQPVPAPDQGPAPSPTPRQPAEPQALGLTITGPNAAVFVNQPIRYDLKVTNPSSQPDGNVSIRFNLPEGVDVIRVTQPLSPELGEFSPNGGYIYLKDIGTLRPFESIDYLILLTCNQPKTFTITAEAVSRGKPLGARSEVTTQVFSDQ
ncbi:DUF11 domain-containing protein [Stieleria maiorica]|uniref:DUF11 domain-containing protein n=1 Tax=Stieleria maiorica TaxID=2795974 RepID=UPI00142F34FF|nr:DUF11 domain-containing protein [Stieleria maiorica]